MQRHAAGTSPRRQSAMYPRGGVCGHALSRTTKVLDLSSVGARKEFCAWSGQVVRSALTLTGPELLSNHVVAVKDLQHRGEGLDPVKGAGRQGDLEVGDALIRERLESRGDLVRGAGERLGPGHRPPQHDELAPRAIRLMNGDAPGGIGR
jgi:hypothetical protein